MTGPSDEMARMLGGRTVLAGRYDLTGLLGSGGMGTVYRARDRELDEIVALKVLKNDLAQVSGMLERFRNEVKLARKVTHPNVVRTFDIGEDAGDRFFTMEYVDGEPLSALIARERPPVDRVLSIAAEILDGLAASHDAGVVHGDLKPENVICAKSGRIVITDFGISRALATGPSHEQVSAVALGTPAYMAPEQIEGLAQLDGRTDLYALGCIMFRLVTGTAPWKGVSYVSLAAARLSRDPPDPREHVPELDDNVRHIILRCMARHRNARFQDARATKQALMAAVAARSAMSPQDTTRVSPAKLTRAPSRAPSPIGSATKTVAVLPLASKNGAANDDAYLIAGLTDDLTDVLSVSPQLRVRPRGTVEAHGVASRDVLDVGRALGVDVIITGTLGRDGDLVCVVLRLVTVGDGFQLWAKRFDRPASQILAIADEAGAEIAEVLASDRAAAARAGPADALALDLYLRGRFIFTRKYFDAAQAVALFRAAHERAPSDGRIASALALALMRDQHVSALPDGPTEQARGLADGALRDDPQIAEAHVALALVHLAQGELRSTAHSLERALEIAHENADARLRLGYLLLETGRPHEAIDHLKVAKAMGNIGADASLARAYGLLGSWAAVDEALESLGAERSDPRMSCLVGARLALWRDDPAHAEALLARSAAVALPEGSRHRVEAMLEVAIRRELTPRAREIVNGDRRLIKRPRLRAFLTQVSMEILCAARLLDEAREGYAALEAATFIDVTWLDECPVIEPLRTTPEHAALQKATLARAEVFRNVFDRRR